MGHTTRVVAAFPQRVGETGKTPGGIFGELLARRARLEAFGVLERPLKHPALVLQQQIVEREFVNLLHGVGEIRVQPDRLHIRNDEQWRVFESDSVAEQLRERRVQVLVLPLILPSEAVATPNVRVSVSTSGLAGTLLERVPRPIWVGFGGRPLIQQRAQIDEVFLCCGALFQRRCAPLFNESIRGHVIAVPSPARPGRLAAIEGRSFVIFVLSCSIVPSRPLLRGHGDDDSA